MRYVRLLGSIALWIGALLGVVAGAVWTGGRLDIIQPMIVISGSMEPGLMTGDLLIDRYVPADQVDVGDVLSLPSEATGKLVTHRVISIDPLDSDRAELFDIDLTEGPRWEVRMQGDANGQPDLEAYFPGDRVLEPWIQIPMAGKVVSKLMEPAVALPTLVALLALLGVSLLDEEPRRVIRRTVERVARRNPRLDELDRELAAVGIDVTQFEQMDDLDRALFSLGIDVANLDARPDRSKVRDDEPPPASPDPDASEDPDVPRRRSIDREPALTG